MIRFVNVRQEQDEKKQRINEEWHCQSQMCMNQLMDIAETTIETQCQWQKRLWKQVHFMHNGSTFSSQSLTRKEGSNNIYLTSSVSRHMSEATMGIFNPNDKKQGKKSKDKENDEEFKRCGKANGMDKGPKMGQQFFR